MKILVLFYSTFGHIHRMAQAVAEGAYEVDGAEVDVRRIAETLPYDTLHRMGALQAQETFSDIPVATISDLENADGIVFGTPTRFGGMAGPMRDFLDSTGELWARGALVGKPASVFASSGSQHGGQESTILGFHVALLHHGMVVVGLPPTFAEQKLTDNVMGCGPYGATTICGQDGERWPTTEELAGARFQGAHLADIARRLARD